MSSLTLAKTRKLCQEDRISGLLTWRKNWSDSKVLDSLAGSNLCVGMRANWRMRSSTFRRLRCVFFVVCVCVCVWILLDDGKTFTLSIPKREKVANVRYDVTRWWKMRKWSIVMKKRCMDIPNMSNSVKNVCPFVGFSSHRKENSHDSVCVLGCVCVCSVQQIWSELVWMWLHLVFCLFFKF